MNGKKIILTVCIMSGFIMSGCSSKSFIFGENKGFCEDCHFQYRGVCASPMDIYKSSDVINSKKVKCTKKKTKRVGVRY